MKGRGKQKDRKAAGRDPLLNTAIGEASGRGLWIMSEGRHGDPKWTIYSRKSGQAVLTYRPKARRWWGGTPGDTGTADTYSEALKVAASRAA